MSIGGQGAMLSGQAGGEVGLHAESHMPGGEDALLIMPGAIDPGDEGQALLTTDGVTAWGDIVAGVTSVNGESGTVVLDNTDVGAAATSHTHAASDVTGTAMTLPPSALPPGSNTGREVLISGPSTYGLATDQGSLFSERYKCNLWPMYMPATTAFTAFKFQTVTISSGADGDVIPIIFTGTINNWTPLHEFPAIDKSFVGIHTLTANVTIPAGWWWWCFYNNSGYRNQGYTHNTGGGYGLPGPTPPASGNINEFFHYGTAPGVIATLSKTSPQYSSGGSQAKTAPMIIGVLA